MHKLSYLGGIFDGEGCIEINKHNKARETFILLLIIILLVGIIIWLFYNNYFEL